MFKELHNRLGENGTSLTVLSLLKRHPELDGTDLAHGDLQTISQQLLDSAGDDEVVDMYSVYPTPGGSLEFLALELVPLRQAIEELRRNAKDHSTTELRIVDPGELVDEQPGAVSSAMSHLRDALRQLFNRAGENGQELTVLSLLSEPVTHEG